MKVHFFTRGDKNTASSRVRVIQIIPILFKLGIKTEVYLPFSIFNNKDSVVKKNKSIIFFLRQLKKIDYYDIVYLQKGGMYNKYLFVVLFFYKIFRRVKIIFDFDDAIFINNPLKTYLLVKISDYVVVGGHYLQGYVERYNKNVSIIPTSIPYLVYSKNKKDYFSKKRLTIGWLGYGPAHYGNLKLLRPVFLELINEKIEFEFILIGSKHDKRIPELFNIKGLNLKIIDELDWNDTNSTVKLIQKFDIGVMPLVDDKWSKGKCSFKAIEYMACGVPVLISAVGENNYLIDDGKNGFLVNSTEDWKNKIKLLISNPSLRESIGISGQKTIEDKYSYEANVPKLVKIFESI